MFLIWVVLVCALPARAEYEEHLRSAERAFNACDYERCVNLCKLYISLNGTTVKNPLQLKAERMLACKGKENVYSYRYMVQYSPNDSWAKSRLESVTTASFSDRHSVFFNPGSSTFDGSQSALMSEISGAVKKDNNVYTITAYGSGASATARANLVRQELVSRGIASSRLTTVTSGSKLFPEPKYDFLNDMVLIEKTDRTAPSAQAAVSSAKPTAKIDSMWVVHSVDSRMLEIHLNFSVSHMKDRKMRVVAYFYDADGNQIKDENGSCVTQYGTVDDYVCVSKWATPKYESSRFSDFVLYMPYGELHQKDINDKTLQFRVCLWDYSVTPHTDLYRGAMKTFPLYPSSYPYAILNNTWSDHNVMVNDEKNMKVHFDFTVVGMKGKKVKCQLWFYKNDNKTLLKDADGNNIYVSEETTPNFDVSRYKDYWLTIPNSSFLNAANNDDPDNACTFDILIRDESNDTLGRISNIKVKRSTD